MYEEQYNPCVPWPDKETSFKESDQTIFMDFTRTCRDLVCAGRDPFQARALAWAVLISKEIDRSELSRAVGGYGDLEYR